MSDFANNVTATAALVTSLGILASTLLNARRIKEVKHEVKTANSLTLAQLGDATETRRIDEIPPGDRTSDEKEHIDTVDRPPQVDGEGS